MDFDDNNARRNWFDSDQDIENEQESFVTNQNDIFTHGQLSIQTPLPEAIS